jgi:hypothetical protein
MLRQYDSPRSKRIFIIGVPHHNTNFNLGLYPFSIFSYFWNAERISVLDNIAVTYPTHSIPVSSCLLFCLFFSLIFRNDFDAMERKVFSVASN